MGAPAISPRPRPARNAPNGTPPKARPARSAPAKGSRRSPSGSGARRASATRPATKRAAGSAARAHSTTGRSTAGAHAPRRPLVAGSGSVAMLPVTAVGRTAGAVGGLADCGLVVAMTRSRVWIVVLGILLGGIVALNVWGLSLSAASSDTAVKIGSLQRENSVLRGRIAKRLSNDRIEREAARLGLAVPAPDDVTYLKSRSGDAARAAERLAAGEISSSAPAAAPEATDPPIDPATGLPVEATDPAVPPTTAAEPVAPPIDPSTGLPVDPATGLPADPAAAVPVDPAAG